MIHGATLGDGCLIGLHATVLNRSVVGAQSLVAAGALVKEGQQIPRVCSPPASPPRSCANSTTGPPGLALSAQHYVENAKNHASMRQLLR